MVRVVRLARGDWSHALTDMITGLDWLEVGTYLLMAEVMVWLSAQKPRMRVYRAQVVVISR